MQMFSAAVNELDKKRSISRLIKNFTERKVVQYT